MKSTKKFISVLLAVMILMTCITVSFTVNASTGTLCSYYATNPNGKTGVQKTITIDGDASDWSEDMLIAQGAAWDVANHYKGGHENCVLDTYALFATWDSSNLYVGWQMVNTTDTWAREGDGPLSDGGRVLDVPLILALSVDPTSTSMSNKNTSGGPIWGQKMGLEFDNHVDNLLYMSGKPGLGEPSLFKAIDANGNTNYTTGCYGFSSNGIEYKMAETNICSNIYGLNYSEDPNDVYSDDADWVDYKTFSGSMGTHDTSYDSFYEIKIPLSVLGIDANYIQQNGIGAMLIATRGESGLDCIPFDDTMLDNATGDYASDSSTSHEKDDVDVITSEFARIGNTGGVITTTAPVTTVAPTTVAPTTTEPVAENLTVNAKSNLFATNTVELSENAETVTVRYDLQSAMDLVNGQWQVTYDTSKLSLTTSNAAIMPNIADDVININNGVIKGNFTNVSSLYDFSTSKAFVELTFDVIGTGNTDVTLNVQELSVGYLSGSKLNYKNAVVNSSKVDLSSVTGFTSSSITGSATVVADEVPTTPIATTAPVTTTPVSDDLTVNVTSNFFPSASKTYDASEEEVTVTFMLSSTMDLINSEWALTYDTSKLSFDKSTITGLMPNVTNSVIRESTTGIIKGNFTTLSLADFQDEKAFITVTFDVIDEGTANVDLYVDVLGVAYLDDNFEATEEYIVDFGVIKDVTSEPGFESEEYTVDTIFSEPTVIPTTQPATTPTTTNPSSDGLTVKATSNILDSVSKIYSESDSTVTVSFKLQSTMDIVNGNWILTYDNTVLSYDASKNATKMMPNIPGAIINQPEDGTLKGAFSNLGLYDFKAEKDFVKVTFDIIGSGVTTVDLNLETLGVAYLDENLEVVEAYPVDYSQLVDITGKAGFENQRLSGKIVFDENTDLLLGDVNDDGLINVNDATLIQKYLASSTTFTDDMKTRADVNSDGLINVNDATLIQKYVAQIISSF